MSNFGMIHIVYPVSYSAEKEYIKNFLRFIGCFVSDCPVEQDWMAYLEPNNEDDGIDLVLNYYGTDPYQAASEYQGIRRFYLYFDLDQRISHVSHTPLEIGTLLTPYPNRKIMRDQMLQSLIELIWDGEPQACLSVSNIRQLYTDSICGDLFYLLQAKRCLRVLTMGEVLQTPEAKVSYIPSHAYIEQMLTALYDVYLQLEVLDDAYSLYTRLNAGSMMREIAATLDNPDYRKHQIIDSYQVAYQIPTVSELVDQAQILLRKYPYFTSAYLLLASLCKSNPDLDRDEEACYLHALRSIPNGRKGYAFVWYRIGYFYEKAYHDAERALENYHRAVNADAGFYQALFKIAYYAASDGRYNEAESLLINVIKAIFRGRDPEPDENGEYGNWSFLSLKDAQYLFKAYILLAKICINSNREYSAKAYIGKACLAATTFEEALLVRKMSDCNSGEYRDFIDYHEVSIPVWAMWRVLKPWSESIINDAFVRHIVRNRLKQWG